METTFILTYIDFAYVKTTKEFETLEEAYAYINTLDKGIHFTLYDLI